MAEAIGPGFRIVDQNNGSSAPVAASVPGGTEPGLYVRIVSQPAGGGGGPATIADGADVVEGATVDAAVVTDVNGTVSGKLRGLVKILAAVWDSVNGRLKVDGSGVTQPVSGTVTANPATAAGKTLTYVPVNQGVAGTTVLAAASPGNRHKLVSAVLVLSVLGTLKFTDGIGDLSGPLDLAANAGFVLPASAYPYQQSGVNSALNLVTTLGAARGVVSILTEA